MIKFGFTSDWHISSKKPARRIDADFFYTQSKKVEETIQTFIDNKVSFVIHGGDLFDTPIPDFDILNPVIKQLRRLKIEKIAFYIVPGSHDIFGYNLESITKTACGSLLHAGLSTLLSGEKEIEGLKFYGIPAILSHTEDLYRNLDKKFIIVTHNMLVQDNVPFDHLSPDKLDFCNNLFLCGHYHTPFYIKSNKNVLINIGPLMRTSKIEADHEPSVLIIERGDSKLRINKFTIKHDKNIFDLTEHVDETPKFIDDLKTTTFEYQNMFDFTKKIAKDNNFKEETLQEAINRLHNAQTELYD